MHTNTAPMQHHRGSQPRRPQANAFQWIERRVHAARQTFEIGSLGLDSAGAAAHAAGSVVQVLPSSAVWTGRREKAFTSALRGRGQDGRRLR